MTDRALVIVARYPEAGKTKTRLARALGGQETALLYRAFLEDLARRFIGQRYVVHWAYTPVEVDFRGVIASFSLDHPADTMAYFPQLGSDFGARLLHAFQWVTRRFERTVLIGSDSPHITTTLVEDAFAALDDVDVVLGPADDGGYYLLGMREPYDIFSGIPMSTEVVARMTIEAAQRQGLSISLQPSLFDIDELADLLRLEMLLQQDSRLAPATAAMLASIRSVVR